jgi:predicted RNA binding protein YcfA (HicA-like mRNA interferase family)
MSRLPVLGPKEVIRRLERAGFSVVRARGSHYQLFNPRSNRRVTVPFHGRDLSRATLSSILHQAGLTLEAFQDLL